MRKPDTYRRWLAAVLLAVYSFIATPTQLWHHHASAGKPGSMQTHDPDQKFVKASSGCSAEDCKACAHKYSVYNNAVCFPELAGPACFSQQYRPYQLPFLSVVSSGIANKGPPAPFYEI